MTALPPASSGESVPMTIPLTWNSGRISRLRSRSVSSKLSTSTEHMAARFAWSSITPLGLPVVPLV
jgi:hypothetical protein